MDNLQYILKPNFKREFIPQIFLTLGLGLLLYLGVFLNLKLLNKSMNPILNYGLIFGIVILVGINLFLISRRIKAKEYVFYLDRVEFKGKKPKTAYLSQISSIQLKINPLDRIFNTGTIMLEPGFSIRNIDNINQMHIYIQRLVQYARGGYQG